MICVWIRPKIYKIKNLKNKEKIINDFENKPLLLISQRIIFDKKQNISSSNVSSKSDNNQLNKFGVNISSVKETKSIMNIYSLIYGTINLIKFDIKSKQLKIIISTDINPLTSPSTGAPALKYGYANVVTTSPGEVKGLMI